MRTFKKICLLLALVALLPSFTYAQSGNTNVFTYFHPEITVEFDEGNNFIESTKQKIADDFAGIATLGQIDGDAPDNILCTLFGHDTSESGVAVIRHKAYIHEPRCKKEFYNVTACSRCDYTVEEYMGFILIYCHPEDQIN